jgi:lipopolysaccharide/colanic/teichoic acid biosynthesis glycosyltransferase
MRPEKDAIRFAGGTNSEAATRFWQFATRIVELVAAIGCLVLLAPMLVLVVIAIKFDSPGPIFVRVRRYGYRNRRIEVHKFRAATVNSRGRPPVGQFLSQTGIEDLPMLVNVIRGEMSIMGPPPSTYPTASLNERKPGVARSAELFSSEKRGLD